MFSTTELARRLRSEPVVDVLRDLATEILNFPESPKYRDLTHFAVNHDIISDLILNRSVLERSSAARLLNIFMKYDMTVAQTLLKRTMTAPEVNGSDPMVIELLATMDEASVGAHLGAALVQLLRKCDDKVRSKIALVLGHNRFNIGWALQHGDRRVRANAVEAMWNVDSSGARRLFHQALLDSDNRVRGNAIYGLLLLNDRSVLTTLRRMASAPYGRDRATAAWVMGKTGLLEFISELTTLLNDKDPSVVRQASQAISMLGTGGAETVLRGTISQRAS